MKFNKAIIESYVVSLIVAGVGIWQTGNHHLKSVAWGAAVAVLGPVAHSAYSHIKAVNLKK